jgi:hypothetical protein
MSLKSHFYLIVATCFGLTKQSTGDCYLIEITALHELHVNVFTCYYCMSSLFKNNNKDNIKKFCTKQNIFL